MVGSQKDNGNPASLLHVQTRRAGEDVLDMGNGVFRIATNRPGHDGLSRLQGGDAWSHCRNDTCGFSTQRGRQGSIHVIPQPPLHIGVVHAGGGYLHEDLVRFGDRLRDIFIGNDFWAAKGVDSYGFHEWSFACLYVSARALEGSAETSREPAVLRPRYSIESCECSAQYRAAA